MSTNKVAEAKKKIEKLSKKSKHILAEVKSVFPFDLFPDKIVVDENKVTISKSIFFYSKEVNTIFIKDLDTVVMETSIFFSTLKFEEFISSPATTVIEVNYLWCKDALLIKRLITGLKAADNENIDISSFSSQELKDKMIEIGKAQEV